MLGVNKIDSSNDFKRVDLKGIQIPLQDAVLKKADVTTNEWRFAQEIKIDSEDSKFSNGSLLECDGVPSLSHSGQWDNVCRISEGSGIVKKSCYKATACRHTPKVLAP